MLAAWSSSQVAAASRATRSESPVNSAGTYGAVGTSAPRLAPGSDDGETEANDPSPGEEGNAKQRPLPGSCVVATSGDAMLHFALHYIASGRRAVYGWCPARLFGA